MTAFLKTQGILLIILGISMVLMVPKFFPLYGLELNLAGAMFGRWCGAAFIGIGIISFSLSSMALNDSFKGVLDGLFVFNVIGLGVTLFGQMQGTPNILGWTAVAVWLVLTAGMGYFRFLHKSER